VDYHLEEHYGIPLETPGRRKPSRKIRDRIFQLYDQQCFSCGSGGPLHIDHIRPQAKGGDSAFRNLQPLCGVCGNLKRDTEPEEIQRSTPSILHRPHLMPGSISSGSFDLWKIV
jgi:5-methylcytosine-specific restriction endonuclease McrA